MTYWLLIILIFSPQMELKDIHFLEAFKSREACVEVMLEASKEQPRYTHMHCFPGRIPPPTYRLPVG